MKNYMFYLATLLFVFASCEKETMEPEMMNANFQVEESVQKAHIKKVQSFRAHLTGDQEAPDPVDTDATGQTNFKLSKDYSKLQFKLIVANIQNLAAAHIHIGEPGSNGPVAVTLYNGPIEGRTSGIVAEGMITDEMISGYTLAELIDIMIDGGAYVNVHTSQNPGGEIRGQISANN